MAEVRADQRVEILTGSERRRSYPPAEKARMVAEAFRPGVVVSEAARRFGVHESLLYRWRRLMTAEAGETAFVAVTVTAAPEADAEPSSEADASPSSATPLPAPAPPVPAAGTRAVMEIALPGGARVRLEGAVDPGLATAVLAALAPPRRTP